MIYAVMTIITQLEKFYFFSETARRRDEIAKEIERQKLQQEMKEKKRQAFLKRQNKIYCKIVWKELADKNAQK